MGEREQLVGIVEVEDLGADVVAADHDGGAHVGPQRRGVEIDAGGAEAVMHLRRC